MIASKQCFRAVDRPDGPIAGPEAILRNIEYPWEGFGRFWEGFGVGFGAISDRFFLFLEVLFGPIWPYRAL